MGFDGFVVAATSTQMYLMAARDLSTNDAVETHGLTSTCQS
jgi:hypothetical protein